MGWRVPGSQEGDQDLRVAVFEGGSPLVGSEVCLGLECRWPRAVRGGGLSNIVRNIP